MSDYSGLKRQSSGAVINTDMAKLNEHLLIRQQVIDIENLKRDVSDLRQKFAEICVQNNIPVSVK